MLAVDQNNQAGWVQPSPAQMKMLNTAAIVDAVYSYLLTQAQTLRAKYANGPIVITGFALDLVLPNLSFNFNFK